MSSILETRVEAKIVWRLVKISDTKIWLIMTKAKYYQDDEWRPRKKRRVVALGDCERAHANWRHMAHRWCTLWGVGTSVETVETNVQVWKLWKCELPTCSPHFSGSSHSKIGHATLVKRWNIGHAERKLLKAARAIVEQGLDHSNMSNTLKVLWYPSLIT